MENHDLLVVGRTVITEAQWPPYVPIRGNDKGLPVLQEKCVHVEHIMGIPNGLPLRQYFMVLWLLSRVEPVAGCSDVLNFDALA